MKIAILGAGNVGATLGKRFVEAGHQVVYGVRDPEKYEASSLGGKVGRVSEVAADAEVILLALPYGAAEAALKACGDLAGKIVIDATNPFGMTDKGLGLILGFDTSGAEQIAGFAKGARLVKCFNQMGFNIMADPKGSVMFVCGDDAGANETVRKLAAEVGFDAVNIGDLAKARLLEPLAALWVHLAFTTDLKRDFAFAIKRV